MPNRSGKLGRIGTALMLYESDKFFFPLIFSHSWILYILATLVLGRLTSPLCFVSFVCFHFPELATHSALSTQLLSFIASIFLDIISPFIISHNEAKEVLNINQLRPSDLL